MAIELQVRTNTEHVACEQLRMAVQAVRARDQAEARIGNIIDALCCTVRSIAEIAPADQTASAMPATSSASKASAGGQADSGAVRSQKAASTWRELLRTVEQLHQAWVRSTVQSLAAFS